MNSLKDEQIPIATIVSIPWKKLNRKKSSILLRKSLILNRDQDIINKELSKDLYDRNMNSRNFFLNALKQNSKISENQEIFYQNIVSDKKSINKTKDKILEKRTSLKKKSFNLLSSNNNKNDNYLFNQLVKGVFSMENNGISKLRDKKRLNTLNDNMKSMGESEILKNNSYRLINFENIEKEKNIYRNILKEIPYYYRRMKSKEIFEKNKISHFNEYFGDYLEKVDEKRKRTRLSKSKINLNLGLYLKDEKNIHKKNNKLSNMIKIMLSNLNDDIRIIDLNLNFKFRVHYLNIKLDFLYSTKFRDVTNIKNDLKTIKIYLTYKIINGEKVIYSNEKIALYIDKNILLEKRDFISNINLKVNHLINTKITYRDLTLFSKIFFLLEFKDDLNSYKTLAGTYFNIFDHNKKMKIGNKNSFFLRFISYNKFLFGFISKIRNTKNQFVG